MCFLGILSFFSKPYSIYLRVRVKGFGFSRPSNVVMDNGKENANHYLRFRIQGLGWV